MHLFNTKRIEKLAAAIYDPCLFFAMKPIRHAVMNRILDYKKRYVLDLCCGTGNQLKLLSKNGFKHLYGIDLSAPMLHIAEEKNHLIKLYNRDATKTGFTDGFFELVLISFAIHEKDRHTQEALIRESHRLIKNNGILLVVDFFFDDKTSMLAKTGINTIERIAGKTHYKNFKSYIKNKGLLSLIHPDKFKLSQFIRKPGAPVAIFTYEKR